MTSFFFVNVGVHVVRLNVISRCALISTNLEARTGHTPEVCPINGFGAECEM